MISTSNNLKKKYDNYYSDKTEDWRKIGAVKKVQNIIAITKGFQFNNLIDVGAGDGNILSLLSETDFCKELTAVEISDSAINQIKKKKISGLKEIKQFDGYNLPFEDNQFELCICSHVIEHVEYPRKLLQEIKRISINQVFEIPIDFSFKVDKKFNHFNKYGHINIYTPSLFNFLLFSTGFKIIKSKPDIYDKNALLFQTKKYSFKYFKILCKIAIWEIIPSLKKLKPNTYTVLTK